MSEELPETKVAHSQKERRVPSRVGFQEASRVRESYSHGAWDIDLSHCLHLLFTVNLIFWEKSTLSPGRLGFLLLPNQVVCFFFPHGERRWGGELERFLEDSFSVLVLLSCSLINFFSQIIPDIIGKEGPGDQGEATGRIQTPHGGGSDGGVRSGHILNVLSFFLFFSSSLKNTFLYGCAGALLLCTLLSSCC